MLGQPWIEGIVSDKSVGNKKTRHRFGYSLATVSDSLLNDLADACAENRPHSRISKGNAAKLFPSGVPDDSDVVDLAVRINAAKGSAKSLRSIAREFTGENLGDDARSRRLLARLRMLKRRGKLNL